MPPLEARITYIFSQTFGTVQGYIVPKSRPSTTKTIQVFFKTLINIFSVLDLKFYAQQKLIELCQANKSFVESYIELSKYAAGWDFNNKALKYYLSYTLSEKLSCQLVSINLKNLTYHQLIQDCQT